MHLTLQPMPVVYGARPTGVDAMTVVVRANKSGSEHLEHTAHCMCNVGNVLQKQNNKQLLYNVTCAHKNTYLTLVAKIGKTSEHRSCALSQVVTPTLLCCDCTRRKY